MGALQRLLSYAARLPINWKTELAALDSRIAIAVGAGRADDFDLARLQQVRAQLASLGGQYGGKETGQPATGAWGDYSRKLKTSELYWGPLYNAWEAELAAPTGVWLRADAAVRYVEALQLAGVDCPGHRGAAAAQARHAAAAPAPGPLARRPRYPRCKPTWSRARGCSTGRSPRVPVPQELAALEARLQVALANSAEARAYLAWTPPSWP